MKTSKSKLDWKRWTALLGAAAILGVSGCADRNNNGQPDSAATSGEVANATDNAGDAAGNVGDAAGNVADSAGKTAANAADDTADVASQITITGKIKTALLADTSLGATGINVDTVASTKTVTLSGQVTNAAQKKLAEAIAKKEAPGYKVDNKLAVKGGASPVMKNDKMNKKAH